MSECVEQQKLPFRSGEINKSEFGDGDRTGTLTAIHGMFNNDVEHCMAAAALLSHLREGCNATNSVSQQACNAPCSSWSQPWFWNELHLSGAS